MSVGFGSMIARRPPGRRDGGQFATHNRAEADISLGTDRDATLRWLEHNGFTLTPEAVDDMLDRLANLGRPVNDLDRADALRCVHEHHYGYGVDDARTVSHLLHTLPPDQADALQRVLTATRPTAPAAPSTAADESSIVDVSTLEPGVVPAVVGSSGRVFYRATPDTVPAAPNRMRVQADRHLDDEALQRVRDLFAYRYAATVGRGDADVMGEPERDTTFSFVVEVDPAARWESSARLLDDIEQMLVEGSPIRSTDRSGPGTRGTRAVEGLGAFAPRVAVYFDDVDHL